MDWGGGPARLREAVCAGPGGRDPWPPGFRRLRKSIWKKTLDLNEYLVPRPEATFFVRVSGDSMIGAAIHHNDILVVDRSQRPCPGNVVIAMIDGEFTVKRLRKTEKGLELAPENPDYPSLELTEDSDFQIWGVVRHVVHKL